MLLLLGFEACGYALADALFKRRDGIVRLWLGLTAGLLMMMWLPSLFAYALRFTAAAQLAALGLAAVFAVLARLFLREPPDPLRLEGEKRPFCGGMPAWLPVALVAPLLILSIYLQYTHTLRDVDGALHVGQSTYGDLCLHLGIATGLQNSAYPPQYTLIQDALLGYPFLMDALSASMLCLGTGLQAAFVVPGSLMMGLVYLGFILLAWELTHSRAAVVLSYLLMFLNGGLGFFYVLDGVWQDPTLFKSVFTGYYDAPANMVENNIRWVNVICDMMIPQRTLLAGWTMVVPALYLLALAMRERSRRLYVILGVLAGAMPMVHTHSFLALALVSAGCLFWTLRHAEARKKALIDYALYAGIAAALALPQLLTWSIPQTVGGAAATGSLSLRFNWVNYDDASGRLIDGYFWFWVKNVGPVYLLMVPAALLNKGWKRGLSLGALMVYAVAELIQFQPNPYDNNKLFYVAFLLMLPLVGSYLTALWNRLRGLPGRALLAAVFLFLSLTSGVLSLGREAVSDYQLFSAGEVEAAEYIRDELPADAVYLTGNQHNNLVAALAGRQIVCGTSSYLYFHGVDYQQASFDARRMLEAPADSLALFAEYGVDYVVVGDSERYNYALDEAWFAENCALVYDEGGVSIYAVPENVGILPE